MSREKLCLFESSGIAERAHTILILEDKYILFSDRRLLRDVTAEGTSTVLLYYCC